MRASPNGAPPRIPDDAESARLTAHNGLIVWGTDVSSRPSAAPFGGGRRERDLRGDGSAPQLYATLPREAAFWPFRERGSHGDRIDAG
jgi:hypothetical protein